jgi:hypothetical protein
MASEQPTRSDECYLLWGSNGIKPFVLCVFLDLSDAIFALLERYKTYIGDSYYPLTHSNTYNKDTDTWTFDMLESCVTRYWITARKFNKIYEHDWKEKYFIDGYRFVLLDGNVDWMGEHREKTVTIETKPLKSFFDQLWLYDRKVKK